MSQPTGDISGEDGTGLNPRCESRNVPQAQPYSFLGVLVQKLRRPVAPSSLELNWGTSDIEVADGSNLKET